MTVALPTAAAELIGPNPTWIATFAARVAARLTGLPVVLVIVDEPATGLYAPRSHRQEPWIEVRGRYDDPLCIYTVWHEVGHAFTRPNWTSERNIWLEFHADQWAVSFYMSLIPDQAAWARRVAEDHLRGICDVYHAAGPDEWTGAPAVLEEVALWCGWEAPR
jgi:hypothetical protein